jgi:hypothetical protein
MQPYPIESHCIKRLSADLEVVERLKAVMYSWLIILRSSKLVDFIDEILFGGIIRIKCVHE